MQTYLPSASFLYIRRSADQTFTLRHQKITNERRTKRGERTEPNFRLSHNTLPPPPSTKRTLSNLKDLFRIPDVIYLLCVAVFCFQADGVGVRQ